MKTTEEILLRHLEKFYYHIVGVSKYVNDPIECYEALKDRNDFKSITPEEKAEDAKLAYRFQRVNTHLEKISKGFLSLQKLIVANIKTI